MTDDKKKDAKTKEDWLYLIVFGVALLLLPLIFVLFSDGVVPYTSGDLRFVLEDW